MSHKTCIKMLIVVNPHFPDGPLVNNYVFHDCVTLYFAGSSFFE